MAAIFGLVGLHTANDLHQMADRLRHRGPCCQLETVHERLSLGVIGPAAETLLYRTDQSVSVATGAVYSVGREIREADPRESLAELVLRRFDFDGLSGVAALDGEFAAVICRLKKGKTIFLRDFFGCAPLFWSVVSGQCFAFASEYKAIFALNGFAPVVDRKMLQYLQDSKHLPVGRTLLSNVRAARPGITTIIDNQVVAYRNFAPLTCRIEIRDEETAQRTIAHRFREVLQRRAGSVGPIGLALSGGIDSIGMAFQLRDIFPDRELHTFTAGYGHEDPEMRTAAEVAADIGAIHHPVLTPPSLVAASLAKLVWHMEDPCARSEALQLLRIAEVARGYVPALMSGQGADGLFAGMPRHKLLRLAGRLPLARGPLFELLDLTQLGLQPETLLGKALAALVYHGSVPPVPTVIEGGQIERPARHAAGPEFLNRVLAFGFQKSVQQDIAKFERPFAASGLGFTSPFLDLSFARIAFTIDERLKIRRGVEKYVLRAALAAVVPQEFCFIPKYPQRMRYDLEFADQLDHAADVLLSPAAVKARGFFEPRSIRRLRRRRPGRPYAPEAAMRLWTAVSTETWARLFLDQGGVGAK
jgi:asparagine synthase (glutamine-hydrolysing)